MKSQLRSKRIIIVLFLCILVAICFVSYKSSRLESKSKDHTEKSYTGTTFGYNQEVNMTKDKNLAKESDYLDLTIKSENDKVSAVESKTKIKKEEKPKIQEQNSKNKAGIETATKPIMEPEIKPNTKPEKKKVWIVDQKAVPAWDEIVEDYDFPTGYDREYYWIEGSGISEKYYSGQELNKRLDELADKGIVVSWGNGSEFVKTGYMKKTIHHPAVPEKGHWEWK